MYADAAATVILRHLLQGRFVTNNKVTPIRQLAQEIDASYVTIQKALKILESRGVLESVPGKGVFVKHLEHAPDEMVGSRDLLYISSANYFQEYEFEIYRVFQQMAREKGYRDCLLTNDQTVELDSGHGHVAGALVSHLCPLVRNLKDKGLPIVYIAMVPSDGVVSSVSPDFYGGCRQAVRYLHDKGHRRIQFVGPSQIDDEVVPTFQRRYQGFCDMMKDLGIDPKPYVKWHYLHCEEQLVEALKQQDRPTAILASNDIMAAEIMALASKVGLDVPGDLSVMGLENMSISRRIEPPLTTLRYDKRALGEEAINMLLGQIQDPQHLPTHRQIPTTLVERDSVTALRTSKMKTVSQGARGLVGQS